MNNLLLYNKNNGSINSCRDLTNYKIFPSSSIFSLSEEKRVENSIDFSNKNASLIPKQFFLSEKEYTIYHKRKKQQSKIIKDVMEEKKEEQIIKDLEEILDDIMKHNEWFVSDQYQSFFYSKINKSINSFLKDKVNHKINLNEIKYKELSSNENLHQNLENCNGLIKAKILMQNWEKNIEKYKELESKLRLSEIKLIKKKNQKFHEKYTFSNVST